MSTTVTMEEAQAHLPELVARLAGGEELIITQNQKPVAKLVRESPPVRQPRKPGNCKGMIILQVEDDEHLQGFAEYMP
jgi:prevent-host-death family protein